MAGKRRNRSTISLLTGFTIFWMLFCAPLGHFAQGASEPEAIPAIAFASRLIGDDKRARLIIDFDKKISYDAYFVDRPNRLIIDLEKTFFSFDDELNAIATPLIKAVSYGEIINDTSRIVVELNAAIAIEKHQMRKAAKEGRYRLIFDLVSTSLEGFKKTVRKNVDVQHKAQQQNKQLADKAKKQFTIVLDPGHGGVDGGASGTKGTFEKNVTLNFALALRDALVTNPAYKVVLTRQKDGFVSLAHRVDIARDHGADLMLSIHADSLKQRNIRGATVYTLSKKGSDALARRLAEKENKADLAAGLALPKAKPEILDILIDLTRRETKVFSKRFAQLMVRKMRKDIRFIHNPIRSADFHVLKAPEVPSVLLELGYLSNSQDEALLRSKKWHKTTAQHIKKALDVFFAARSAEVSAK